MIHSKSISKQNTAVRSQTGCVYVGTNTNKMEAVNSSFEQVLITVTSPETCTLKRWGTAVGRLGAVSSCMRDGESICPSQEPQRRPRSVISPYAITCLPRSCSQEVWEFEDPFPGLPSPCKTQSCTISLSFCAVVLRVRASLCIQRQGPRIPVRRRGSSFRLQSSGSAWERSPCILTVTPAPCKKWEQVPR